jgi:hypothetical protein
MDDKKQTVSEKWLEIAAIKLEFDAESNLQAWIILGQSSRYSENLGMASVLRRAIEIKNIRQRRDFLRDNGVKVK